MNNSLFQVEQGKEEGGRDTGCIINGRLQNLCSIQFSNGDKFKGIFKDGYPNGNGEMIYKQSIKSTQTGNEGELGQYKGMFRSGKREGKGKMIWADGSCFEGEWKNDERFYGKMIMNNGCVYIGHFLNDKFHGHNEMLLMPSSTIYLGEFKQG